MLFLDQFIELNKDKMKHNPAFQELIEVYGALKPEQKAYTNLMLLINSVFVFTDVEYFKDSINWIIRNQDNFFEKEEVAPKK